MEHFFSSDLPYLLRDIQTSLLVVCDFNSVLTDMESTGHQNYIRVLQELLRGFDLVDVGDIAGARHLYSIYMSGSIAD
jgi:hypothetical protein